MSSPLAPSGGEPAALTASEITDAVALIDAAFEGRHHLHDTSGFWESIAGSMETSRTSEQLMSLLEDAAGDVDIAQVLFCARTAREGRDDEGSMMVDVEPWMDSPWEDEDGEDEREAASLVANGTSRLTFSVGNAAKRLREAWTLDDSSESGLEEEEEEPDEEGEEEAAAEEAEEDGGPGDGIDAGDGRLDPARSKEYYATAPEDHTAAISAEVTAGAALHAAAAVEDVAALVLELAGNAAMDMKHRTIQPSDIQRAVAADADLATLAAQWRLVLREEPASIPRPLALRQPLRVDVYWRALDRFPGGNCDSWTVRYRFDLDCQSPSQTVSLDYHHNWDGVHHAGSGSVITQLQEGRGLLDEDAMSTIAAAARSVREAPVRGRYLGGDGATWWHAVDDTARDADAFETEWTSVEVLVYDTGAMRDGGHTKPFLRLKQVRKVGPQYRPQPSYQTAVREAPSEQLAVIRLFSTAVGMGRPHELSEGSCPAAADVRQVRSVEYPVGIPYGIYPQYFVD